MEQSNKESRDSKNSQITQPAQLTVMESAFIIHRERTIRSPVIVSHPPVGCILILFGSVDMFDPLFEVTVL